MGNACCNKSDDVQTEFKTVRHCMAEGETTDEDWNVEEVGDEGFAAVREKINRQYHFANSQAKVLKRGDEVDQEVRNMMKGYVKQSKSNMQSVMESGLKKMFLKKLAEARAALDAERKVAKQAMSAQIEAKNFEESEEMPEEEEEDHQTEVVCQNLAPAEQEALLLTTVPIIKLSEASGNYLIGNRHVQVVKEADVLTVRVSDAESISFDEYVKAHALECCIEILAVMETRKMRFQEVMVELLKENEASEETIERFTASTDKTDVPFAEIVKAIRDRDVKQLPEDYGKTS